MIKALKDLEQLLIRSWWVILFIILCYFCYEQGLQKRNSDFVKLQNQYLDLLNEKSIASNIYEELMMQMNSQSDPEWIELTLMKGLGLVPEGQIKVFFSEDS